MNELKFYVKVLTDGIVHCVPIDGTIVYTHCCKCGKEMSVYLEDLYCEGEIDLESSVTCEECI